MKKILYLLPFAFCLLPLNPAYAQTGGIVSDISSVLDIFVYKDVGTLISNILSLGLIIASVAVIIYLLWGGLSWITSGGDKGQLENARNRITSAIIGLLIVAAVWAIFLIIKTFLVLPINTPGSNTTNTSPVGSGFNGDCCTVMGGSERNPSACCNLLSAAGCLTGRNQATVQACGDPAKFKIDWGTCWGNYYQSHNLNDANDPCKQI